MLEGIWPEVGLQGQALTSTAAQLHSTSAVLNLSLSAAQPPFQPHLPFSQPPLLLPTKIISYFLLATTEDSFLLFQSPTFGPVLQLSACPKLRPKLGLVPL